MIVRNATLRKTACIAIGTAAILIAGCAKSEGAASGAASIVSEAQAPAAPSLRRASVGKARAPVRVEFDRSQGLEPGQAEQIEVTFLPQATLDNLRVEFKGSDGLVVQSGAQYLHSGAAAKGVPVLHRITVAAPANGRYRVSVVISTSVSGAPIARALAIPVVIGEVAARVQVQSTAEADSTGQRIKVLPGVRRTR